MFVRLLIACLILMMTVFSGAAFAEDKDIEISGTFDGYSMFSLNRPVVNQVVPLRAFDYRHAQFSLNYAEVAIEKKAEPFGFRADIGFGDTTKVIAEAVCPQEDIQRNDGHGVFSHSHGIFRPRCEPNGTTLYQYLQQAYIMAKVNGKVQVDFGKFVTPLGAEVIETKDNWNYSRGLLFTYAVPIYHFGVRANVQQTDSFSYALYVVNGWNNVQDNNAAKTVIGSITYKPTKRLSGVLNIAAGNENPNLDKFTPQPVTPLGPGQLDPPTFSAHLPARRVVDLIMNFRVSDGVSLMLNYDYGTQADYNTGNKMDWKGLAAYAKVKVHDKLIVIPRYEWMHDTDGFMTGAPQVLQDMTVTFQVPVTEAASLYFEWRRDWNRRGEDPVLDASQDAFDPIANVAINNVNSHNFQHTFLMGFVYSFMKK